jgi:hypothetical protein
MWNELEHVVEMLKFWEDGLAMWRDSPVDYSRCSKHTEAYAARIDDILATM